MRQSLSLASSVAALLLMTLAPLHSQTVADLGNQELAAVGLIDVTAAPFHADPTGVSDSSDALNAALVFGRENGMVTYLPAGDYKVSKTIAVAGRDRALPDSDTNRFFSFLQGETHVPGRRSRIILAPHSPGFAQRNPVRIVVHAYNPNGPGYNYTDHFNQVVRGIDIVIGEGNSGAVGLRLQGAEGTLIEDVTIDATHGWKGVWGVPGSGGSTHRVTVIGGEIGIDLRGYSDTGSITGAGTQPGPTLSQIRLLGQTDTPMPIRTRGTVTVVGAEIVSATALKAFTLQSIGTDHPWNSSLALVDATVDLGDGPGRVLVQQLALGGVPGRGYTLHNVHIRGIATLDSVSGLAADAARWTRFNELAVAVPPASHQGNTLQEILIVDGEILPQTVLVDAEPGRAPDRDFVAFHGPVRVLPTATLPGRLNIVDFGADPAGARDSTAAIQQAIDAGRDVFVPKGVFAVSDTLYLKPDTRLFGIHPHHSQIRARDALATGRFAGLQAGDVPAPMVESADDRNARTVISMVGLQAPRSAANHRRDPVLVYPLKWQSGRYSILHHTSFSPYGQFNWRLQNVMGSDFGLAQERGQYLNGGLEFSSNDLLGRMFIEQLGGAPRITMPYSPDGSRLQIRRADGQPFALDRLELGKATFGEGIGFEVEITGTRADSTVLRQTIPFPADWTSREAFTAVNLDWTGLTVVAIHAALPFSIANVISSAGSTDFERTRPLFVSVDCADMRRGFEHFPFAAIRHPQLLVTGNGGGRWYNAFHHGDLWCHPEFRFIEVRDTTEPLHIYHWHLQHVHSDSQAEFRNARHVSVYGIKSEHNSRFLSVLDSDHIRVFGFGGLADAEPGGAHLYVENTPNWLHAAFAEEPHFFEGTQVWSTCDNPLIVHHVRLFDGIQEQSGDDFVSTPVLARTILFKRGRPVAESTVASYAEWAALQGYAGAAAQPGADPDRTGHPNLLRYALGMDADPWLGAQEPLSVSLSGAAGVARARLPLARPDAAVFLRAGDDFTDRPGAARQPLERRGHSAGAPAFIDVTLPSGPRAYAWLEAELLP